MDVGGEEPGLIDGRDLAAPSLLVFDRDLARRLKEARAASGIDGHDEVWEGVYVVSPQADIEHQRMAAELWHALRSCFRAEDRAEVLMAVNVSDREAGWIVNYRVPDVAVFLRNGPGRPCGTHWVGGPDLAVEILSDNDPTYEKMAFYAGNGVREMLVIDRDPWAIELHRLVEGRYQPDGVAKVDGGGAVESEVVPATLRLFDGEERTTIEVVSRGTGVRWLI